MVRKVSPLTHATATHNPTTKKNNMGKYLMVLGACAQKTTTRAGVGSIPTLPPKVRTFELLPR